jgi:hypothetical protein
VKNQYFGDEKDYLTYGLLRTLARVSGLPIGVAWMLTPDAPDGNGELRAYLDHPAKWQAHDPALFEQLSQVVHHGRSVALAGRFNLIPGACYFGEQVPRLTIDRSAYFQRLFTALQACPLLFLDPDNGLETRSVSRGQQRSPQHVYWDEIEEAFVRRGHSLLVFQHFPRRSREEYLEEQAQQFIRHLAAPEVTWFQTTQVAFFLIARPEHRLALQAAAEEVSTQWSARIKPGARPQSPLAAQSLPDGAASPQTSVAPLPHLVPAPSGLNLSLLRERLAVCRLAPDAPLPGWAGEEFTAITRTPQELSIVCAQEHVPHDIQAERGWRALMVDGPLDFGLTGILASLASPLAAIGISIFALSTYDTDYLLIKEDRLEQAIDCLRSAGHHLNNRESS